MKWNQWNELNSLYQFELNDMKWSPKYGGGDGDQHPSWLIDDGWQMSHNDALENNDDVATPWHTVHTRFLITIIYDNDGHWRPQLLHSMFSDFSPRLPSMARWQRRWWQRRWWQRPLNIDSFKNQLINQLIGHFFFFTVELPAWRRRRHGAPIVWRHCCDPSPTSTAGPMIPRQDPSRIRGTALPDHHTHIKKTNKQTNK